MLSHAPINRQVQDCENNVLLFATRVFAYVEFQFCAPTGLSPDGTSPGAFQVSLLQVWQLGWLALIVQERPAFVPSLSYSQPLSSLPIFGL